MMRAASPLRRAFGFLTAVIGLLVFSAQPAVAQDYRIVPGDILSVSNMQTDRTSDLQVDLDGRIRIPNVGAVPVAGLTLDEVEGLIDEEIAQEGLLIGLNSTVAIARYAPVVVVGDVAQPGRFDYLAGMTVATALGLSGGSRTTRIDPLQVDRARIEAETSIQTTGLEIASTTAEIARLERQLLTLDGGARDGGGIPVSDALRRTVPAAQRAMLDDFLVLEREILENSQGRLTEQDILWNEEIRTLEQQAELLDARRHVQEELVAKAAEDLARAEQLEDRGLQTAAALSRAQQVDADARTRALELDSLSLVVQGSLSEARRGRSRFLRSETEETLRQLRDARERVQDARLRHARALEQLALLDGGNIATLLSADVIRPQFTITRQRADQPVPGSVGIDTPLFPGDTLLVTLDAVLTNDG